MFQNAYVNEGRGHMHPTELKDGSLGGLSGKAGNAVTQWIFALKQGDQSAAVGLWEAYFCRLVGLARVRLRDTPRLWLMRKTSP